MYSVCTFTVLSLERGWEFSSYKIELRNQITQNDVTIRVTY